MHTLASGHQLQWLRYFWSLFSWLLATQFYSWQSITETTQIQRSNMTIRTRKYRSIDVFVINFLIWALILARLPGEAKPPQPESDPWVLQVCAGLAVLTIGGVVIYKIVNFCESRFPRTNGFPRTNTANIVMQGSANMTDWVTVFETNCYLADFEYRPDTNSPCMFYRAMFP